MGCIYRRVQWHCTTCNKRLDRTADRKACEAAGHTVEKRQSPVYWISYRRAGKSYAESVKSPTCDGTRKKDAVALLVEREGDIGRGKPVTPKMGKLTFEDAAADLLAEYKSFGRKSYAEVERRLKLHLTPYFGGWRMANITMSDIDKFVAKRQTENTVLVRKAKEGTNKKPAVVGESKPASNAEINRELAVLKRMFSLAVEAGKLLHKPKIKMRRESAARAGFFELEQYESVLTHLPAEIRPVIQFAYVTGWRIKSEVLPLEWRQVDFKAGEVKLDAGTTKNREGRVFPMTTDLRTILKAQHVEQERLKTKGRIVRYVFHREAWVKQPDGTKQRQPGQAIVSFKKAWKVACRKAGCPGRIPHDLRRTAIRNLVRTGTSETVAMKLSGHKTRSVFDRYNIVSGQDLRDAAKRLDENRAV